MEIWKVAKCQSYNVTIATNINGKITMENKQDMKCKLLSGNSEKRLGKQKRNSYFGSAKYVFYMVLTTFLLFVCFGFFLLTRNTMRRFSLLKMYSIFYFAVSCILQNTKCR